MDALTARVAVSPKTRDKINKIRETMGLKTADLLINRALDYYAGKIGKKALK